MKLAWLSDLHLNFLKPPALSEFFQRISNTAADVFVISGDIGEADDLASHLLSLEQAIRRPIYFVLGNHDYYGGSIERVRNEIGTLCDEHLNLHWLSSMGIVALTRKTCLIGHDGWGDGRYGDYWGSEILLNDWALIEELIGLDPTRRRTKLEQLGDEAATHFRTILPNATKSYQHIVVATHVPPFCESCWHNGQMSGIDWLPHFACKAVGDVLREAMIERPDCQMTVLCGHTHSNGEAQILSNLQVVTGWAVYGSPEVLRVMKLL